MGPMGGHINRVSLHINEVPAIRSSETRIMNDVSYYSKLCGKSLHLGIFPLAML